MKEPCYYRLPSEYRRSIVYIIASLFVLIPVAVVVDRVVGLGREDKLVGLYIGVVITGLAGFAALRWMIRVDEQGLAQRILFWWDRWDWSDLASGHIEKGISHVLMDRRRSCWRRKLRLILNEEDLRQVVARINEHYVLPPPPSVPSELRIKYSDFFRRVATFDAHGVTLVGHDRTQVCLWSEIRRVHITRMDTLRRDFRVLEIFLPQDVIELKRVSTEYGNHETWRGATAEQINEFLVQHLPSEKLQEDTMGGPKATVEDANRTLNALRKKDRELRVMSGVLMIVLAGVLLYMAWDKGVFPAVAMTLVSLLYLGPFWFLRRDLSKNIRRTERMIADQERSDSLTARESLPDAP